VAKQNTKIPVSKLQVLELISDKIALGLFNHIGKNRESSDDPKQVLGLTRKQYYSRCSRLLKLGLIKRKQKSLVLTSLGDVVYQSQIKIARAAEHSWKLKVIDALTEFPENEQKNVMNKLITDPEMRKLISIKFA
jgi:predicted transcriptional regulator